MIETIKTMIYLESNKEEDRRPWNGCKKRKRKENKND
jgi:hypothetical protein